MVPPPPRRFTAPRRSLPRRSSQPDSSSRRHIPPRSRSTLSRHAPPLINTSHLAVVHHLNTVPLCALHLPNLLPLHRHCHYDHPSKIHVDSRSISSITTASILPACHLHHPTYCDRTAFQERHIFRVMFLLHSVILILNFRYHILRFLHQINQQSQSSRHLWMIILFHQKSH